MDSNQILQALQGLVMGGQAQPQFDTGFGDMSGRQPIMEPQPNTQAILAKLASLDTDPYMAQMPMQAPMRNAGGPQMAPQQQVASNNKNISAQIQQALGAQEVPEPTFAQNILSSRFNAAPTFDRGPSYGDFGSAIAKSAAGKTTSGQDVYNERSQNLFTQLAALKKAEGSNGGATGQLVDRLMAEDPKLGFRDALYQVQTGMRQGTQFDANGNIISIPGYNNAKGSTKFAEGRGTKAGQLSVENNTSTMALDNLDSSITQARSLLPKVSLTGPILGRVGNAANDPEYANLQGALNGIVLQAKELYNLGSGQGFSDADRDFLGQVVAGAYSRADTISLALDRLAQISAQRKQFINQQNQSLGNEFGYGGIPSTTQPTASPAIDYTEYFK